MIRLTAVAALLATTTLLTGTNPISAQVTEPLADTASNADVGATAPGAIDSTLKGQANSATQDQFDSATRDQINSARQGQLDADLSADADVGEKGPVDNDARATTELNNQLPADSISDVQSDRPLNPSADAQPDSSVDLQSRMGLQFGDDSDGRLTVGQLTDGLAMQAGLQTGDEIIAVGGQRVAGNDAFWQALGNTSGSTTIHHWRNGRILQTNIADVNRYQANYRGQGDVDPPPAPTVDYGSGVVVNGSSESYYYPNQPTQYQPRTNYRRGWFGGWARCR